MLTRASLSCLAVICGLAVGASDARAQATTEELKRMSLEDLLDLRVTTVSRRPEVTSNVPAAVYVITQDDIRRSGATSIPEALRLAPGIQVARIDAGKWAIGMRGFADRLARSMLVLVDGRAVYSPLFAGTYWEVQDTLLDDIDRIEVIRGPGGTLWGANAVNGVVNIITKPAAETQGTLIKAEGGTVDHASVGVQYGGMAADGSVQYRFYGKGRNRGHEFHADGQDYDSLGMAQGGFRADRTLSNQRVLTVQGDAYRGRLGELATATSYSPPFEQTSAIDATLSGANLLARLSGSAGDKASFQLQAYYDRTSREELPVGETRDTVDIDFQKTQRRWSAHDITWGLGYRVTSGRITADPPATFLPPDRTDNLFSGFLQDDVLLVRDRLRAGLGTKLEHNNYSGFEVQPSARLLWTPDVRNTFVWSLTRAVRTPSRVETDYTTTSLLSSAGPTFVRLVPDKSFTTEKVIAHELGYRVRPAAPVYLTFSGFFNQLEDMLSTEVMTPFVEPAPALPHLVIPVQFANGLHGNSHGLEITADVRPAPWWRWTTNYSYLRIQLTRDPGSRDVQEPRYEGMSPRHQLQMQTSFDLPRRWSVDALLRHVSELPFGPVPAYTTTDVHLAWQMTPRLELALVGQDLNQPRHVEWLGDADVAVAIRRSGYLKMTWRP